MAVQLLYSDSGNWTLFDASKIVYWGIDRELNKPGRVIPVFFLPIVTTDIWNGFNFKVQEKRYDVWEFQFAAKEEQLQEISKLKSCDSINIIDLNMGLNHIADTETGESFIIQEPEKISNTTTYLIKIQYKTNKTLIDKINTRVNVVTLSGASSYFSKFEKLSFYTENEKFPIEWNDTIFNNIYEVKKTGFKTKLYFTDAELTLFKADYQTNTFTIDAVPVIEKLPLEISEIAEGITMVIVSVITTRTIINIVNTLANVVTFAGNSTYYSKLSKQTYAGENTNITVEWSDGTIKTLRQNTPIGYNILLFFNNSDLNDFKNDYGQNNFTIDAVPVIQKLPLQVTPIGDDFNQVIVQVVTSVDQVDTLSVTNSGTTNNITFSAVQFGGALIHYTDYPINAGYEETEQNKPENQDGVGVLAFANARQVSIVKFWMNNATLAQFRPEFETNQVITLNAVAVLENRLVEVTELADDINEVIVQCLISTDILYPQQ